MHTFNSYAAILQYKSIKTYFKIEKRNPTKKPQSENKTRSRISCATNCITQYALSLLTCPHSARLFRVTTWLTSLRHASHWNHIDQGQPCDANDHLVQRWLAVYTIKTNNSTMNAAGPIKTVSHSWENRFRQKSNENCQFLDAASENKSCYSQRAALRSAIEWQSCAKRLSLTQWWWNRVCHCHTFMLYSDIREPFSEGTIFHRVITSCLRSLNAHS